MFISLFRLAVAPLSLVVTTVGELTVNSYDVIRQALWPDSLG